MVMENEKKSKVLCFTTAKKITSFLLGSLLLSNTVWAADEVKDYPKKPIMYVIGFSGISDSFSRVISAHLQKRLGQPVVVQNKIGAQGEIAASYVSRAKPDGYTIGMVISNSVTNHM